jgi:hypothetical protein
MGLKADLPELAHVVVVGGSRREQLRRLLSGPEWENEPDAQEILCGAAAPAPTTSRSSSTPRAPPASPRA